MGLKTYLTHKDLSKYWIFDIEADGLYPSRIWCAAAKNCGTKEVVRLRGHDEVKRFVDSILLAGCYCVGHNILVYDGFNCNRLLNTRILVSRCVDTLVLSYLYNPVLEGGHSLSAWGPRVKCLKGEWSDFSKFSEEMLDYCVQDVEVTYRVFLALTKKMRELGFSERSCQLEHEIAPIIARQQRNGFAFDLERGRQLLDSLRAEQRLLGDTISKLFPPELVECGTYRFRVRKDGDAFASYTRHRDRFPQITRAGDTYTVWDWSAFNIASPAQRLKRLITLGFHPTKFTKKGNPQVDEDTLVQFAKEIGEPGVQAIADWLVAFGRGNMIETWLKFVGEDGRIHGRVFSCGAGTRRMTHREPNTANIPTNEAKYGRECRELWRASEGRVLVGYDAASAQMRMFGHYLGNPEVVDIYTGKKGDPHQRNADLAGVTRGGAKASFYALIFGAQDKKLGAINKGGADVGARVRAAIYESTPGLEECTKNAMEEYRQNNGRLVCVDGGLVLCPSPHAALCYKVQSAEGVMMKTASVILDRDLRREGIEHWKVGDIHDEGQHETSPKDAQRLGELAVRSIRRAGEELNFSVPMDGGFKVGASWADTH